jgi:hypothetical protein
MWLFNTDLSRARALKVFASHPMITSAAAVDKKKNFESRWYYISVIVFVRAFVILLWEVVYFFVDYLRLLKFHYIHEAYSSCEDESSLVVLHHAAHRTLSQVGLQVTYKRSNMVMT